MDIASATEGQIKVKDETCIRNQKLFQDFLEEFTEDGEVKYLASAKELTTMERCTLEVNFEDIEKYNQNLATVIIEDYYRIYPYLCQAVKNFVKDRENIEEDKEFFVGFTEVPTRHNVRQLTTAKVGTLIRISGQVVRTHPVHPELVSGTFICLDCQTIVRGVEQQFKYTQPLTCRNPTCPNRRRFLLELDKSKFVDFQKIRIQETQAELPRGCVPRSLEIIVRGELVELVQAGDRYDFTGTLIVVPDVASISLPGARAESNSQHRMGEGSSEGVRGLKILGVRDLSYRMSFLACSITPTSAKFGGSGELLMEEMTPEIMKKNMTEAEWTKIYSMNHDKNLYNNLVRSLFPTIHGNDQVKKGVLLMLFGGVPKTTKEGTSLRGDVNCCLVGDPSTAKSQVLKLVSEMSVRAVYTSGKASTAAGLTAAVVRDEESGDFVIEAGALMLADNGVCCIDEFDKMDPHDQVAIHEAMEQQTISIAKAGVRATLNARTSILAAANPIGGRYDRTKSLQQNVELSAPIMSRFDLFFVLLDECNEVIDYAIARKIIQMHTNSDELEHQEYSQEEVLRYITFARQFKPIISEEASKVLVELYIQLRQRDGNTGSKSTWRITVRQLESMIRLSEAMAKMECLDEVSERHVIEAYNLLSKSIIRVEQPDIHLDEDEDSPQIIENGNHDQPDSNGLNGDSHMDVGDSQPTISKKKMKLTYEEYKTLSNMILSHMRKIEEEGQETGITRSDLVSWYLMQISERIDSEEELIEKKSLVEKVLDRLTYHDKVIIPLTEPGETQPVEGQEKDPLLVVHPNFFIDS